MEEVIFQGSSARRAVNVAEVSLYFDNSDGSLPVAFNEVVITRRLSRSGESDYFLNRSACRLRDIHDLMRGTGLGADSGVVIESRMIDALLSDRPDERRELFEEAAGVGLYRDRRRSTERRLEETSVDLARLDDLIAEVQSQVRALARQRRRAEKSEEIARRRFSVELTLATRDMAEWHDELARLKERVALLREQIPDGEARLVAADAARGGASSARAASESLRTELARAVAQHQQGVLQLQGEMAVAEERQRNAQARRARAEEEQRESESHGTRVAAERELAAEEHRQLDVALRATAEDVHHRLADEDAARAAVAAARAAVEGALRRLRDTREQQQRLELDRESGARELAEVEERRAALDVERGALGDAVASVRREITAADDRCTITREAAAIADGEVALAREALRLCRDADSAARASLARLDETLTALQGKLNALETLERERVGLAPAAARLLEERGTFGEGTILGPLSDFISADAAAALVVERFLGNTVHAIVVRDRSAAHAIRQWHKTANPGPLLLLPVDSLPDDDSAPGESTLAHRVDAAGPARAWVRSLLGHVEALDDGAAFVDARGAVFLPGLSGGPGPLRRRAEVSALRGDLESLAIERRAAAASADAERDALASAESASVVAAEALAVAQQHARRAEEERQELSRRLERARREMDDADALQQRLQDRRETLTARVATLSEQANALQSGVAASDAETAAAQTSLLADERAQEDARERRTAVQVAHAQDQARVQLAAERERRLAEEVGTANARLTNLHSELASLSLSDEKLAEQMTAWQTQLADRQAELRASEASLADAEQSMIATNAALEAAEEALASVRRATAALVDEMHHAELRFTELSGRRAAIRERLETEWRRPLDELLTSVEPLDVPLEELRAEAESLRQQVDALGPVNALAIEEHEEELKRFDFLTTQRDDLSAARLSLQQAIREIDLTARELFLATFTQVRENFRHIFMTLFGGGECDLRLEDPHAPLDCDIEIHASPRGKRTQRIHLLSSGERALVALSLLFGIFLTKPSPFCLLDEVDAPLDDQNIGRFVRMLNQFKSQTQFIVITHNPRTTTEAADAVYGVTMQEPGVSSLVSVRMRGRASDDVALRATGNGERERGNALSDVDVAAGAA